MKPSGAHTHPAGSGAGTAALVVGAAILAAAIAGPVAAAVAELLRLVVIAAAAVVVLALAAGTALVALRLRQHHANRTTPVSFPRPVPWQRAETLSAPRPPAIGAPREVHIHIHGASAEDIAAALRQLPDNPGRSAADIEED